MNGRSLRCVKAWCDRLYRGAMKNVRIEKDTFGPIEVPAEHLWGAQTQRSLHHFHISTEKMAPALLKALVIAKKAAARVNAENKSLSPEKAQAIERAADEV